MSLITPFLLFSFIFSQEILWEKRIDILKRDLVCGIVLFQDGNIGIVGITYIDTNNINLFLYKISQNGDSIFLKIIPQSYLRWISNVLIDNEENIYFVGYGETTERIRFGFIAKLSKDGELIFRKNFYYGKLVRFWGLTLVNNCIFVSGEALPNYPSGPRYGILAKYDKEGNLLLQKLYIHHDFYEIKGINGYLYLTGSSYFNEIPFIKMDTLGDTLFIKRDLTGVGFRVDIDSFGNIIICGNGHYGEISIRLVKYDQNGNLLFSQIYPYGEWDFPNDMEVNPYSEIFVSNFLEHHNPLLFKWHLIKYNQNGEEIWQHIYFLPDSFLQLEKLAIVNRNEIIAGGTIEDSASGNGNLLLMKYLDRSSIKESFKKEKREKTSPIKTWDISGKLVKEKVLKKGVYIIERDKKREKVIIFK